MTFDENISLSIQQVQISLLNILSDVLFPTLRTVTNCGQNKMRMQNIRSISIHACLRSFTSKPSPI